MNVTLRGGNPIMVDFTPTSGDVTGGDVIAGLAAGLGCKIAHRDITNNTLGSVAVGGGVYEGTMLSNYAVDTLVYYDPATDKFTTTSTNNYKFGFVTKAAASANTVGQALHDPGV